MSRMKLQMPKKSQQAADALYKVLEGRLAPILPGFVRWIAVYLLCVYVIVKVVGNAYLAALVWDSWPGC